MEQPAITSCATASAKCQYRLDPAQVKLYAAEHCGTAELRDSTREQIESFVNHLAEFASRDRQGLLAKLSGYGEKAAGAA